MIIIASETIPGAALQKLNSIGQVLLLHPIPEPYPAIASHPDIFFCQKGNVLFGSPLLPDVIRNALEGIHFVSGESPPGKTYPQTAIYNAVFAGNTFVHHLGVSDPILQKAARNMEKIHVNQAYTRCNVLGLSSDHFITSDRGIEKQLLQSGKKVLYIDPRQIVLRGQKHGFFGGACGVSERIIYVCGDYKRLEEAEALEAIAITCGYNIESLCDGPVTDVGSIIFAAG